MDGLKDLLQPIQEKIASKIRIKEKWIRAGFTVIPNSLLLDKRISPQAKTLFCILCLHAFKKDDSVKLSYETIEEEIGLGRTQLYRALSELKELKLVEVIRTGRASDYEIIFSELNNRVDWTVDHLRKIKKKQEEKRGI